MKKVLIITTINDLSIPLFLMNSVSSLVDINFCFFHESFDVLKNKIEFGDFDVVYMRDPFTYPCNEHDLQHKLSFVIDNKQDLRLVDGIASLEDIYFEDKWLQYQKFSAYMPKTCLLSDSNNENISNYIIKKRISSRGKGIVFDKKDVPEGSFNDYIIQEKIDIEKEYRVYVVCNQIIDTVSIKSSKTKTSKIKVIHTEQINDELVEFVKNIIADISFDFVGLDIAYTAKGYSLIEINRSPQFNAFYKYTNINLAENLIKTLLYY